MAKLMFPWDRWCATPGCDDVAHEPFEICSGCRLGVPPSGGAAQRTPAGSGGSVQDLPPEVRKRLGMDGE